MCCMKLEPYWSLCIDCLNLKKKKESMCEDKWMFFFKQKKSLFEEDICQ